MGKCCWYRACWQGSAPSGRSFHQSCRTAQGSAVRTGPEKNPLNSLWFCPCSFACLGACWYWYWSADTSWFHLQDMPSSIYNASRLCCVCCGTHICTPAVLSVFVTPHSLLSFDQTLKRPCVQFIFIWLVFFVLYLIVYSHCCCSHVVPPPWRMHTVHLRQLQAKGRGQGYSFSWPDPV
jgi:hypothetical protein